MKLKIIIAAVISILCTSLKAQEIILGEKKPCPGETYEYSFNGTSCDGNIMWSVNHGTIVERKKFSVKVIWQEGFVGNGAWHVRAHYTPQFGASCGTSTYFEQPIKVNAVSDFKILGDDVIPGGFRGTKTYTAQIKNALFPATSYLWTTKIGTTITTTTTTVPTFNLNITNDNLEWIMVQGKNSTCSSLGASSKMDISMSTIFSGPNDICSEGTYTLINPGTVTLENAAGIATLTSLGNNKWKVTRINGGNGIVKLKSTKSGKSYDYEIKVGGSINLGIESMVGLQDFPSGDQFTVVEGTSNYKYTGVLTVKNSNNSIPTTYTWTKILGTSGIPLVTWSSNNNKVVVQSKGVGGSIQLRCTVTSGCAVFTKDYTFYLGNSPY
ncbi:hypothetical protein KO02_08465 [Sphingobacterium sp. ML3W]|uniref:hypothetical protein n=1 Tax=Sphingobacterium sp. ML3W TaxID=1538644 RepID=UPI0004F75DD9|nr:hypothetical protein [Sphingobacterium sp. ML3W]AIM36731.1 hypothetical protein KO02_08465 [Sphingobacterium sp. ML3W]